MPRKEAPLKMAPVELEFRDHSKVVVEPGWDIDGIISNKFLGDYRLRIRLSCSKDDKSGGAVHEVLKVRPRIKLGPLGIFEKREIVDQGEIHLQEGQSAIVDITINGVGFELVTIRHKIK